ncbi:hypothetical protein VE25_19495 [Devosia geojensis]|uniref:Uncharacterized protein n=1 Tax=Devosia geojensis TaxID=443610 RepID=A0A0F5FFT8_9HYPH|nr:hypothetical protein [Devosia geojensis]KKB07037.1 hypothetical protein VE25_19495 [Devosia geojensis]
MSGRGGVRSMRPEDVPEVGRLFNRVFRDRDAPSSADFDAYFAELCFGSPAFRPEAGSIVHLREDGAVDGAIGVVPMQVRAGEDLLTGRLMSIYMTDPDAPGRGGAELVLTIRPRHQDFCFCDSANAVSADHYKAIGGLVLPVQSLAWHRTFRPVRAGIERVGGRLPAWARRAGGVAAGTADAVLRSIRTSLRQKETNGGVEAVDVEAFAQIAPLFLDRFAVAPAWSKDELAWLISMAARNTLHGPLQLHLVRDEWWKVAGAFACHAQKGGIAQVLNVLARPKGEEMVVTTMLAHLDAAGCAGASGMTQPFLMDALCRQPHTSFRHRGYVCLSTRHGHIRDAAMRGDIYLGGLMGESWSRLMADFR